MAGKSRNQPSPVGSPTSGNISDKEQDRFLPIANVSRIMKKSLPANAKISKEAKETVQECVSEFISFITGEASDKCQREKRKTINGDDLLWAMTTLGFENYVGPLKVYLNTYRETEGDKNFMVKPEDQNRSPSSPPAASDHHHVDNLQFNNINPRFVGYGYGDNLVSSSSGFNFNSMQENDGNGNRSAMAAAQLHNGVEW
ncbi:nuclear transcription factor Y subunit B-3-like [Mercurialis annua]|uniref:nuclear transcription factor Y subunit B-3-like n=1 Tax=Mercurialis annua TaxID=3986 RepID=UPI00215ED24C|nr:nuclear transcription factor Y subunit B-3-like [Mercurialis annua]